MIERHAAFGGIRSSNYHNAVKMLMDFDPGIKGKWIRSTSRAAVCTFLTALPLLGFILFFEVSRPANGLDEGWRNAFNDGLKNHSPSAIAPVHFTGISAQLADSGNNTVSPARVTANEAEQAFFDAPHALLKVGYQTEFLTKEGRRLVLRIVHRQPIADQAVPDNLQMMDIAPASTATVVNFVWGQWLYGVEIEDRGVERNLAVQKSL